ncbi:MAG: cytochrome c [Acetobacteraceae bacterium]|nr:cytochrome c [Pseudomonadota bacterium]
MHTVAHIHYRRLAILAVSLAALPCMAAGAADSDIAKGKALAQANCTRCHVITPTGKSGWTNAPSFMAIANRPGMTKASLEQTISQPHMKMLNLPRSPAEARQLTAYILSLKTP